MTIKIKSASKSLGIVEVDGGARFVARAYLTCDDWVFWWSIPTGQLKGNFFYGKDFINALNAIKADGSVQFVRFVAPGITPAQDQYTTYIEGFYIRGQRLSTFAGIVRNCILTQNQDDVTISVPNSSFSQLNVLNYYNSAECRVIDCLSSADRDENNALCSFKSNIYSLPQYFTRES